MLTITIDELTGVITITPPNTTALQQTLSALVQSTAAIGINIGKIMQELDNLRAAVAAQTSVIDSTVTLLGGLKAALDAAGTDPAALAALSAEITAHTEALAAAVLANTPNATP